MTPKMLATTLSLVGVLGAGSAAAMVNTQILDSGPTESGASSAVLPTPSSIDLEVPAVSTTVPESTLPESSTSSSVPDTVPESTLPEPTGFLTAFNVGDAGVVTVDVIDGRIILVSAEPKTGWVVTKSEDHTEDEQGDDDDQGDDNYVEVEFSSNTVIVEFEAMFVDGEIVPKVESKAAGNTVGSLSPVPGAPSPTTTPTTTVPGSSSPTVPSTTVHHDDDEYEDDDEDEDDDEYEDDDDEDDEDEWEDD